MNGFPHECQDVCEAVARGHTPKSDGELARAVVVAGYGAYTASVTGKRVDLQPYWENRGEVTKDRVVVGIVGARFAASFPLGQLPPRHGCGRPDQGRHVATPRERPSLHRATRHSGGLRLVRGASGGPGDQPSGPVRAQ